MSDKKTKSNKHENDANPDFKLAGIGNYTFSKTLGQGNFAQVKLAKHKLTGLEVLLYIHHNSSPELNRSSIGCNQDYR